MLSSKLRGEQRWLSSGSWTPVFPGFGQARYLLAAASWTAKPRQWLEREAAP